VGLDPDAVEVLVTVDELVDAVVGGVDVVDVDWVVDVVLLGVVEVDVGVLLVLELELVVVEVVEWLVVVVELDVVVELVVIEVLVELPEVLLVEVCALYSKLVVVEMGVPYAPQVAFTVYSPDTHAPDPPVANVNENPPVLPLTDAAMASTTCELGLRILIIAAVYGPGDGLTEPVTTISCEPV
jgi:hypothetical protein